MGSAYLIDDAVSAAYRIGYGGTSDKPPPPLLVLLPSGASGAADNLWVYDPSLSTWSPRTLPLSGAQWQGIITNPTSPM